MIFIVKTAVVLFDNSLCSVSMLKQLHSIVTPTVHCVIKLCLQCHLLCWRSLALIHDRACSVLYPIKPVTVVKFYSTVTPMYTVFLLVLFTASCH